MGFISYAQNNEDVLLNRVFGGQQTGFYVDIGAYHPVIASVTKAFYDRGWNGINVEPGNIFDELAAARPRDVNLRMLVLDRRGESPFYADPADPGMSRASQDELGELPRVPCDTLEGILLLHARGRPVDFLKIDAEGAEGAIIRATDWRLTRPKVLLIEATRPWSSVLANQDWEPVLLEHGYVRAYFDGINCFYVPEEAAAALLPHFETPVNVLDAVTPYAVLDERVRARAQAEAATGLQRQLESDVTKAHDAIRILEEERHHACGARAALEAEEQELRSRCDGLVCANADLSALTAQLERDVSDTRGSIRELEERLREAGHSQAILKAECEELREHRDRLSRANTDLTAELTTVARQRDGLASRPFVEAPFVPTQPHSEPGPVEKALRGAGRRLVRASYRLVRPVVRPAMWRLRSFMTREISHSFDRVHAHMAALPRMMLAPNSAAGLSIAAQAPPSVPITDALPPGAGAGAATGDMPGLAEMTRLAAQMERALLTLALESATAPRGAVLVERTLDSRGDNELRVPLQLPGGRRAWLGSSGRDISVGAALVASDGVWEPHVQRLFARTVGADAVCMDIGANIGAHTLALAVLAAEGRVIAFEADPANHERLLRNVAGLDTPKGHVEIVHAALWDSDGSLTIGGADELAGCSFVSDAGADAAWAEHRLRAVVDAGAIGGAALSMHVSSVRAMRLDSWIEANPQTRLDLIKLDVEGAEVRVLRGAEKTIRRYRPILLVEYNPACAKAYFDQPAETLYRELALLFPSIHVLEEDGALTPVADWPTLAARLETGKGWEDLVCQI